MKFTVMTIFGVEYNALILAFLLLFIFLSYLSNKEYAHGVYQSSISNGKSKILSQFIFVEFILFPPVWLLMGGRLFFGLADKTVFQSVLALIATFLPILINVVVIFAIAGHTHNQEDEMFKND